MMNTTNDMGQTVKIRYEVQKRFPLGKTFTAREWHLADYAKRGDITRKLIFREQAEAVKECKAMRTRSAKYGWGAEFRVIKTVTTFEEIEV